MALSSKRKGMADFVKDGCQGLMVDNFLILLYNLFTLNFRLSHRKAGEPVIGANHCFTNVGNHLPEPVS